jgi:hypothetical protein
MTPDDYNPLPRDTKSPHGGARTTSNAAAQPRDNSRLRHGAIARHPITVTTPGDTHD